MNTESADTRSKNGNVSGPARLRKTFGNMKIEDTGPSIGFGEDRYLLNWRAIFQTSLAVSNLSMHAKPGLRLFLKWRIAGSGSVIADVV